MSVFKFAAHKHNNVVETLYKNAHNYVCTKIPLEQLTAKCTMSTLRTIAKVHNIYIPSKICMTDAPSFIKGHHCPSCETHMTAFALHNQKSDVTKYKVWYDKLSTDSNKKKCQRQLGSSKYQKNLIYLVKQFNIHFLHQLHQWN